LGLGLQCKNHQRDGPKANESSKFYVVGRTISHGGPGGLDWIL
jgi:hypothetical protein